MIAGTAGILAGRAMQRRQDASLLRRKHYQSGPAVPGKDRATAQDRGTAQSDTSGLVSRLHELSDLKAMGALTEKEFAAAKSKLLKI